MPCIPLPDVPPIPTIPGGFSVQPPALPRPPTSLLCCNIPPLPPGAVALLAKIEAKRTITLPPFPAPVLAALGALGAARQAINTWKNNLPLNCPRAAEKAIGAA